MRKLTKIAIVFFGIQTLVLFSVNTCYAQVIDPRYQTIFIYQFTKYIEWPKESMNDEFVIGVVGKGKIIDELNTMAATKTVEGKTIKIKIITNLKESKSCNVLFLSRSSSEQFNEIMEQLKDRPVLIITESAGLANKGATINFVLDNNKVRFEVNKSSATNSNLKIRDSLLKLAKIVG